MEVGKLLGWVDPNQPIPVQHFAPPYEPGPTVVLEVHNGDRVTYKRCRRKWDLASGLRQNLVPLAEPRGPLWLGSGFHFALEDFHGYNKFGDPRRAFDAYVEAFGPTELPSDVAELVPLGNAMLTYYVDLWLPKHRTNPTLWVDGVPQIEVYVQVPITEALKEYAYDRLGRDQVDLEWWTEVSERYAPGGELEVVVHQTFDRVEKDEEERIWGVDYKTAKQFASLGELDKNPQASQYFWALQRFYGTAAEGLIWQQHLKTAPEPPEELKTGGFSLSKSQKTTYSMYRATILEKFGGRIPKGYVEILNHLASLETPEGDKYIRRDFLRRNEAYGRAEEQKILAEVFEMLSPDIPLYPNPTRDCGWDCPFKDACTAMDDGSDFEWLLKSEFVPFQGYRDDWRANIQWPPPTEGTP